MKRLVVVILVLLVVMSGSLVAQPGVPAREPTISTSSDVGIRGAAKDLALAMDIPENLIVKAGLGNSDARGSHVFNGSFSGFPVQGDSFAAISSGKAKDATLPNSSDSLSTILEGSNTAEGNDLVQLKLTLEIPANATFWGVDFKFFSEEFPEFVGSSYNDTFLIETPDSTFVINADNTVTAPNNVAFDPFGNLVGVNTTGPFGMTAVNAAQTTYDGATGVLTAYAAVPAGETEIKLIFSIFDVSDSIYDTTVFLDNFRFVFGDTPPGDSLAPSFDIPPSPTAGTVYTVEIGEPLSIDLQATDPDSVDTVSFELLEEVTGASITNNGGNPGTGTFNWTPTVGQDGLYLLPFIAVDNNGASSLPLQLVAVVGNIAPVAVNDAYTTPADTALTVSSFNGLLSNDTDLNADPLTVNTTPVTEPLTGDLVLNTDGSFTYTPVAGFYGVIVFTYEVSDGEKTDTAQVAIQIGTNLLLNAGFEDAGTSNSEAVNWKRGNPSGEKRICNKPASDKLFAFTGDCAFQFTGTTGYSSSVGQTVNDLTTGAAGDTVVMNAWVEAKNLSAGGKLKIVVKQTNGDKAKISDNIDPGTYDYVLMNGTAVLTGTADKLKAKFRMVGGSGKYWLDDVYVSFAPPAAKIALPEASGLGSRK